MNDSFVVYASYLKAAKRLNDADRLAVYDAIMEYGIEGTEPETDGVAAAIFEIVKPLIDANMKKREAGRKGGEAKRSNLEAEAKQNEANAKQTEANRKQNEANAKQNEADPEKVPSNVNVNANVNANANENVKGGIVKGGRFQRPTPAEVAEYCKERGNGIDPEAFLDYYDSVGWKINGKTMKDWKAAVRTWERRDKERGAPPQRSGTRDAPKNKFNQFSDRQTYDFAEFEQLISAGVKVE